MEAFFLSIEREFPKEEIRRNIYIKIELSAMSSFFISPEEMETKRGEKLWGDLLEKFYLL